MNGYAREWRVTEHRLSGTLHAASLMRKTGLSQHTVEKILAGLSVRPATLQRVTAALE